MNVKITLLTLLVILAATTMVATTVAAAFNEALSTTSIETVFDEETFGYLTLSGEVEPEGDPRGGGWPSNG
jgi:hypothetical protein